MRSFVKVCDNQCILERNKSIVTVNCFLLSACLLELDQHLLFSYIHWVDNVVLLLHYELFAAFAYSTAQLQPRANSLSLLSFTTIQNQLYWFLALSIFPFFEIIMQLCNVAFDY